MAYEALRVRRGRLLRVMDAEALVMECRLDVSGVAGRSIQTSSRIGVAGAAVRHPEFGGDAFGGIVTLHAVEHPGQGKIRETGAPGNRIVTGGAIDAELLLYLEMRDVRELHIDVFSGHRDLSDHAALLGEAGILDFLGRMATAASDRIERRGQGRLHARLGVTLGALGMPWELRKGALLVELVTEGAIGAEAGCRVNAGLLIHVHRVRELKQDGARRFVAWK